MTATIRLTAAEAIVRFLTVQRTTIDGREAPLVPGVFAIFGHGNVTCLGPALHAARDELPTWRGQNEQGMALAAIAYAKAMRRRQVMVATTSIGPGALNLVTAAGVAMANRLPVLMLAGDTFQSRLPDPVLQQVEHFGSPGTTANDTFRAVVRYWDRITRPEQVIQSLPQAIALMLDPAACGPAFIALPQDVQAEAYEYPARLFEPVLHEIARPRPDAAQVGAAAALLADSQRPLIIAGGGVHYSLAEESLAAFAARRGIPVVETVAGKSTLPSDHPNYAGPIGVIGAEGANRLAAEADVVLAVGTRLGDFATGSWSVFQNPDVRIVGVNATRFDAHKHRSLPVVADAREALIELDAQLGDWSAPATWTGRIATEVATLWHYLDSLGTAQTLDRLAEPGDGLPTYAQVVGAICDRATEHDYALTASGGFPGELNNGWRAHAVATFDCEYGFSCMGYELSGGWGAAMARSQIAPDGETIVFVGDGSYLMLNSDLYSSVLSGHKMIVVLCDNGGYAVIDRLQVGQGGEPFNNLFADVYSPGEKARVDFAAHAVALGCEARKVSTIAELGDAFDWARTTDRTTVIVIDTDPHAWTEGGAWWEVGVPETSDRAAVQRARRELEAAKARQRRGV
jgi:3D-(3,5/4)-trihydroxycyclohexane-1,2-dione acylhydrolase (decyclizing)